MTSVDALIDTQANNVITVGNYLDKLDSILQLFCSMKADAIAFESCIALLAEQVDTEGEVNEQNLSSYNEKLKQLFNGYLTYLSIKGPSANGIAINLIETWTSSNKCTSHKLSFMDTGYRWFRCKDICSVDNVRICEGFDGCGHAARFPINVGCGTAYFDSVDILVVNFVANTLYKLDANCKEIYTDVDATYSGTEPQDKAANAVAADFTFASLDSEGATNAITFSDPSPAVSYDDVFGNPSTDGAVTGSITFPVAVTGGGLCDVSGNAITEITFTMSANYTGANTGIEFDTVTVTGVSLSTKRLGFTTLNDYRSFLCDSVPRNIHLLLTLLDKNCLILSKCIDHVNLLVSEYDLLPA